MATQSYNLASININNISNTNKLNCLHSFLRTHNVDIALLQEIESSQFSIPGYTTITNVDNTNRGTAIALKPHIRFSHVERSLDSRLIALKIHDSVTLVNIYAPSGSQHRVQREEFFNTTLSYYLRQKAEFCVIGGDFNAVVHAKDATGESNYSLTLKNTTQQLRLVDVWDSLHPGRTQYTYVTHNSASRIDRVYVSSNLVSQLRESATHVCSFTNHKALTVRLCLPYLGREKGRGYWSIRPHVLTRENMDEFQHKWDYWTRLRRNYSSWMNWWVELAKPKIKSFFRWKTSQKYAFFNNEQQRLYVQLREAYDQLYGNPSILSTINLIKGKMLRLQRQFTELFMFINETYVSGEPLSSFQLGERQKKKTAITRLELPDRVLENSEEIEEHTFHYFRNLYAEQEHLRTDDFHCGRRIPPDSISNASCMNEITTGEIFSAIKASASRKSPGPDGIPKEFYVEAFDIIHCQLNLIMNEALRGNCPEKFVEGVIVLAKKKGTGNTFKSFRPISLLNFDFKLLSRMLKLRLDNIFREHSLINNSQKCSNGNRTIFQATLSIKDKLACLRANKRKGKLISFDLDHAFDRVDRRFLFRTMISLGFKPEFVELLSKIGSQSYSRMLINGHLSPAFHIQRSVRQGDPLSMHLFVLYLFPLLSRLEQLLNGPDDLLVAYADDVTLISTSPNKIERAKRLFDDFGECSGALLNLNKTVSLDVGLIRENDRLTIPWLQTADKVKILGITYANSVRLMVKLNWDQMVAKFAQKLWMCKMRTLTLHQ